MIIKLKISIHLRKILHCCKLKLFVRHNEKLFQFSVYTKLFNQKAEKKTLSWAFSRSDKTAYVSVWAKSSKENLIP